MTPLVIAVDDPRRDDIRALVAHHLSFAREHTPPADVHALDLSGLVNPAVTFFSARRGEQLLAIGALKEIDATHGELKSMHTAVAARGQGIGAAVLGHLVGLAGDRGYRRVSLETGTMAAFEPARLLYAKSGFVACSPFEGYSDSPSSAFMTLALVP